MISKPVQFFVNRHMRMSIGELRKTEPAKKARIWTRIGVMQRSQIMSLSQISNTAKKAGSSHV